MKHFPIITVHSRCIKEKKKAIEDGMSQDKILSQEEEMRFLSFQ